MNSTGSALSGAGHSWIIPACLTGLMLLGCGRLEAMEAEEIRLGRATAFRLCQTCHLFPNPEILDRETWVKGALPHMAPWLGVARLNLSKRSDGPRLIEAAIFPSAPVLSEKEWRALHAYYAASAPVEPLVATNKPPPRTGLPFFSTRVLRTTTNMPYTSMVRVDVAHRRLFVGDAQEKTLKVFQPDGVLLHTIPVDSGPVDISFQQTNIFMTLVGRTFPSDDLAGQVWRLNFGPGEAAPDVKRLLRGLPRATHTSVADINGDGRADLVVSGFGNSLGKLSWFENLDSDRYSEHVLFDGAGAVRTHVHDWDGNGRPDIMVLRAQAREGVEIFFNHGTNFLETPVLQFSPAHGCAAWQVLDFDKDGKLDLLIANGDNGDFKSKSKSYHGIRLYRGDGKGRFTEDWFYPMNGAYGVFAADFDLDGDLDIAAISYFPDYKKFPDESFVYLQNEGGNKFQPFILLRESRQGRWLVMDAADIDGDGDQDIVLGSFPEGPQTIFIPEDLRNQWATNRVSIMILENRSR